MRSNHRVGVYTLMVAALLLSGVTGTTTATPAAAAAAETAPVPPDLQPGMKITGETTVRAGAGLDVLVTPTGPNTRLVPSTLPPWLTFSNGRLTGTAPAIHSDHVVMFWAINEHAMLPAGVIIRVDGCANTTDPDIRSCTLLHEQIPYPYAMEYRRLYCPTGTYVARPDESLSPGRLVPWGVQVDEHGKTGVGVGGSRIGRQWVEQYRYYLTTGVEVDITNYAFESRALTVKMLCTHNEEKADKTSR